MVNVFKVFNILDFIFDGVRIVEYFRLEVGIVLGYIDFLDYRLGLKDKIKEEGSGGYKLFKCDNLSDGEECVYRFSEIYFEMCRRNIVWLRELKE